MNTQQTGRAGELLVQYQLLLHGIESAPMTTDRGIDLVAYSEQRSKAVTIQVKTCHETKAGGKGGARCALGSSRNIAGRTRCTRRHRQIVLLAHADEGVPLEGATETQWRPQAVRLSPGARKASETRIPRVGSRSIHQHDGNPTDLWSARTISR